MTKQVHNTKYNYNDLFLRNVLIGVSSFMKNKINIIYRSEEQGDYVHNIPFYFKTGADTQYLIDSFMDDIPDIRVKGNTDIIPRATIGFESWQYVSETFTNPTVWYTVPEMNEDEELVSLYRQIKWVPIDISGQFEFCVETIYEQWAIWDSFIITGYTDIYFTFEHKYLTIQANMEYSNSMNNAIKFDKEFAHEDRITLPIDFTIKTHFPIIDTDSRFSNMTARYMDQLYLTKFNKNIKFPGDDDCKCADCK